MTNGGGSLEFCHAKRHALSTEDGFSKAPGPGKKTEVDQEPNMYFLLLKMFCPWAWYVT